MANYQSVMVDLDLMDQGVFYEIRIDSNNTTALVPASDYSQEFNLENMSIFETTGTYRNNFKCLEEIKTSGGVAHKEIDAAVHYLPGNRIQIQFNPPFTGVIIKK